MLVMVEVEEWYPVLEIDPVNTDLRNSNNPYYQPIEISTDLYNRYQQALEDFKKVQIELKNIYYHK